jgi:hypothetical protein
MIFQENIIIVLAVTLLIVCVILLLIKSLINKGQIIDIINKDINRVNIKTEDYLLNKNFEKYIINNVLFIPYFRHNPFDEKQGFYTYSLRLAVYKKYQDKSIITLNSININKENNIEFNEFTKNFEKKLNFKKIDSTSNDEIIKSENMLVHEINDIDMKLNENSILKLLINVSVKNEEAETTDNLDFKFTTNIRKHSFFDKF